MGLDADNIKKRLSQLELDVKQMNQMIDENLHIDDDEQSLRDSNEEGGENGDSEHEHHSEHEENIHGADDADESREYHETEEHNQSYLQDEILEAIDNTQQSFVQNAAGNDNGDGDNQETHGDGANEIVQAEQPSHHEDGSIEHQEHEEHEEHQQQQEHQQHQQHQNELIQNEEENVVEGIAEETQGHVTTEEQEPVLESNIDASPVQNEEERENIEEETHEQHETEQEQVSQVEEHELEPEAHDIVNAQENVSNEPTTKQPIEEPVNEPTEETVEYVKEEPTQQPIEEPNTTETNQVHEVSVPISEAEPISVPDQKEDVPIQNDNEDEWEEVSEEEEEEEEEEKAEPIVEKEMASETKTMRQESTVNYDLAAGEDKIVLPKHNTSTMAPENSIVPTTITVDLPLQPKPKSNISTPVERRKATNPFRVISVGSPSSATSSRVSSVGSNRSTVSGASNNNNINGNSTETGAKLGDSITNLQSRQEYLIDKCNKLEKEIRYLRQMENEGSLTLGDGKKLNRAINKLQEYLDRKTKERYEVGVLLSRQLRRQINRGENGEFWIGRK